MCRFEQNYLATSSGICGLGTYCHSFFGDFAPDDQLLPYDGVQDCFQNAAHYQDGMLFVGEPCGILVNWEGKNRNNLKGCHKWGPGSWSALEGPGTGTRCDGGIPQGVCCWRERKKDARKCQFAIQDRSIRWMFVVIHVARLIASPLMEKFKEGDEVYRATLNLVQSWRPNTQPRPTSFLESEGGAQAASSTGSGPG